MSKVSVIMAFRNSRTYLPEAIESILNQTHRDFELIIIDDASDDASEEVARRYLSDSRVIYLKNEQRLGKPNNLNQGISMCGAEYVAIMDGDDVSEKNRLSEQLSFLEANPGIAVVGSYVKIIDETGKVIDERTKLIDAAEVRKNILEYGPVVQPSVMFRKSVLDKVGYYNCQYKYGQDIELWYRIIFSGFEISNIPLFLLRYRYHGSNVSHNSKEIAFSDLRMKKEAIERYHLNPSVRQFFFMYAQFLVEYLATGRQRQWIEGLYKQIRYGRK